jgi:hypothetical protein
MNDLHCEGYDGESLRGGSASNERSKSANRRQSPLDCCTESQILAPVDGNQILELAQAAHQEGSS